MNIAFRSIIALGVPFGLYVALAWGDEWLLERPSGPIIFLLFWVILWMQPLWLKSKRIDTDTYGNLLSFLCPTMAMVGVIGGLLGCVLTAYGHSLADIVASPTVAGLFILWGVATLALPGVLGGFTQPLENAGPIEEPRGMMTSHPPPVTSMPLEDTEPPTAPAQD